MLYREPSHQLTVRTSPPSAISEQSTQLRRRRTIRNTRSIRERSASSASNSTRSASTKLEAPVVEAAPSNVTLLADSSPRNLTQPTTLRTVRLPATERLPEYIPETRVVYPTPNPAIVAEAIEAAPTVDPNTLVTGFREVAQATPAPPPPGFQPPVIPGDQRPANERNKPISPPGERVEALPAVQPPAPVQPVPTVAPPLPPPAIMPQPVPTVAPPLPPPAFMPQPPPGDFPLPLPPVEPTTIVSVRTILMPTTIIQISTMMVQPVPTILPQLAPPAVQPTPGAVAATPAVLPGGQFNSSFVVDAIKNPDASAAPGISSLGETGQVSGGIAAFIVFAVLGVLAFIGIVIWAMRNRHNAKKKELLISAKLGPSLDVKEVKH